MKDYINVLKKIEAAGTEAWLVGDAACAVYMKTAPDYMTLAVNSADLEAIGEALGGCTVGQSGGFPILRGTIDGVAFRAFSVQGRNIEEDLARRDFSIEAIAVRSNGSDIDPYGGRRDIRNKLIRLTCDSIDLIRDDPLRALRMLRIAASFEMDVFWKTSADVINFIDGNHDAVSSVPPQRVGREIVRGLRRRPLRFIRLCESYGLLPLLLKPIDKLRHISDWRGGSVFDRLTELLGVIQQRMDTHKIMQNDAFVLAALFCKAGSRGVPQEGDSVARETENACAVAGECMRKWDVPYDIIEAVLTLLKGYRRFYKPLGQEEMCSVVLEHGVEVANMMHEFAVCRGMAGGTHFDVMDENRWNIEQVTRRFRSVETKTNGQSRFLTGEDVMAILGIKPGKRVGELLSGLDMAVGIGAVSSRDAAEEWVIRNAESK